MIATTGSKVSLAYTGQLKDGTVFATATDARPLEVTLGEGETLPGIEEAVIGMEPGQEKEVELTPEKGFGDYDENKVMAVKRSQFGPEEQIDVGMKVTLVNPKGKKIPTRVKSFDDLKVTLDGNHPLAGKDLQFQLRVLEVSAASA
jgi:peptidylprolyl isomerase